MQNFDIEYLDRIALWVQEERKLLQKHSPPQRKATYVLATIVRKSPLDKFILHFKAYIDIFGDGFVELSGDYRRARIYTK